MKNNFLRAPLQNRPVLKVSLLLALILLSLWIATFFPKIVIAVIISVLVSFVLRPFVKFFEFRWGMRRVVAIPIVFVLTGGLFAVVAVKVVPFLVDRVRGLYDRFSQFPFESRLHQLASDFAEDIPFVDPKALAEKIQSLLTTATQSVGGLLEDLVPLLIALAIVPFLTFFILYEGDRGLKKLIERVPNKYFEMTMNVIYKIQKDLVGYLRGWLLDSFIIGLLSIAGLFLIGIDYPIVIGSIAGIANLVPYLGPVVGAFPALLVSVTQFGDFRMFAPIVMVTLTVQLIDNLVVQPICFSKAVDMHPVTVIIVLLIGNQLMGIVGMLIAIPVATILKVAAAETYWGLKNYRITA